MHSRQRRPDAVGISDSSAIPTSTTVRGAMGYLLVLFSTVILTSAPTLVLVLSSGLVVAVTGIAIGRAALDRQPSSTHLTGTASMATDTGRSRSRRHS